MEHKQIDQLIVNSPYEEPTSYWQYNRDKRTFSLVAGRRPAGYVMGAWGLGAWGQAKD